MPELYERKVLSLGGESLLLTLPIGWARFNNLKRGDLLVIEANDDLRIRLKSKAKQRVNCLGRLEKGDGQTQD